MPIIPTRQRQVGQTGIQAPRQGAVQVPDAGAAISQAGSAFFQYAAKMQEDHDKAKAQEALNGFGDSAREALRANLSKEGGEAIGIMKDYQEWYDKEAGKINSSLTTARQQELFKVYSDRQRSNDLDVLANHQAKQNKVYQLSVMESTVANAEKKIVLTPWNDKVFDEHMELIRNQYKLALPGRDVAAKVEAVEAQLKLARLERMSQDDPELAATYLEKWEDDLGAAYAKAKDNIDSDVVYLKAKEAHPEDFVKQKSFVKKYEGISSTVRKNVRSKIRMDNVDYNQAIQEVENEIVDGWYERFRNDQLTTMEIEAVGNDVSESVKDAWIIRVENKLQARETRVSKTEMYNNIENGFIEKLRQGQLTDDDVRDSQLSATKKIQWYDRIAEKEGEAIESRRTSVYGALSQAVDLTPDELTPTMIYNAAGNTLTAAQTKELVKRLNANQKGGKKAVAESVKVAKAQLGTYRKAGLFGSLEEPEGRRAATKAEAELSLEMDEWIKSNPGQDPTPWLESKMDLKAEEALASTGWFGSLWFGEQQYEKREYLKTEKANIGLVQEFFKGKGYEPETQELVADFFNTNELGLARRFFSDAGGDPDQIRKGHVDVIKQNPKYQAWVTDLTARTDFQKWFTETTEFNIYKTEKLKELR